MKVKIELTKKEAYILWAVICWFDKPIATRVLKYKLADAIDASSEYRNNMDEKWEKPIENRIIEVGTWLKDHQNK